MNWDAIYKSFGVKSFEEIDYDQLSRDERETYHKILDEAEKKELSPETLHQYIKRMRYAVEIELVQLSEKDPKHAGLKARLMNYILFEAFFDNAIKARQILEAYKKKPV